MIEKLINIKYHSIVWSGFSTLLNLKLKFLQNDEKTLTIKSQLDSVKNYKILTQYADLDLKYKPIFMIGAPRCGSTLIFQTMLHTYKFSYFQNVMMNYKYSVAYYTYKYISPKICYCSDYISDHGHTNNKNGPHEAWPFWRRFYPRKVHDYIHAHRLKREEIFEIQNTIKFLEDYFNAPFYSKNLEMSLRLKSLQKLFPSAIYIIMKRDPRGIASSLLNARLKYHGNPNIWWSMRPKEYTNFISHPFYEQLAYQVACIYRAIYDDIELGTPKISIYYEDFCENPKKEIKKITKFLEEKNVPTIKNNNSLPSRFVYKKNFNFNSCELERMKHIFENTELLNFVDYKIKE